MTNSKEYWKKYYHGRPWAKTLRYIYKRCAPSGLYWKKGIKNFLSMNDIEYLWVRDNAHLLKEPSIDRKNPKGNYTVDNCGNPDKSLPVISTVVTNTSVSTGNNGVLTVQ